ncbi:MAG TPA: hypothetical protein VJZ25_00805 [Gemmatimonadaceae bacterium]|nr:hypothetical protein [Gemmatimonadaceae bacterium]
MASTQFLEDITAHLSANAFTRTFSFSSAQLPVCATPARELADLVILLEGNGLILQLSEREAGGTAKAAALESWFTHDVLKKGVEKIRNTRALLRSYAGISLVNSGGYRVSYSANALSDQLGVILYRAASVTGFVPPRFRKTNTAGFVHVMRDRDYLGICEHLVTPSELSDYLRFREGILSRPEPVPANVTEAALLGQYLFEELDAPPDARYAIAGRSFRGDPNEWVFSYVLDNLTTQMRKRDEESVEEVYQPILAELGRLGRPELREFKTQLRLSLEAVRADRFELPYRMASGPTGCGFLILPGSAEFRLRARATLEGIAQASKYELGLEKQVSLAMWRSGEIIDIDWLYTEGPNPPDEFLDARLETAYPFRRTSEKSRA